MCLRSAIRLVKNTEGGKKPWLAQKNSCSSGRKGIPHSMIWGLRVAERQHFSVKLIVVNMTRALRYCGWLREKCNGQPSAKDVIKHIVRWQYRENTNVSQTVGERTSHSKSRTEDVIRRERMKRGIVKKWCPPRLLYLLTVDIWIRSMHLKVSTIASARKLTWLERHLSACEVVTFRVCCAWF